jgi:hypothetical protein
MISCPHCLEILEEDDILPQAFFQMAFAGEMGGEFEAGIECPHCDGEFKTQVWVRVELVSVVLVEEEKGQARV